MGSLWLEKDTILQITNRTRGSKWEAFKTHRWLHRLAFSLYKHSQPSCSHITGHSAVEADLRSNSRQYS